MDMEPAPYSTEGPFLRGLSLPFGHLWDMGYPPGDSCSPRSATKDEVEATASELYEATRARRG